MLNRPIILDAIGLRCPMPVQKTRKLIKSLSKPQIIHLYGDDPETLHDIPVLLERLGIKPAKIIKKDIGWLFIIFLS